MLIVQALGMAAGHPEEACDGVFGNFAQAGRGTYPTPFAQMINNALRLGLCDLGIEQRRATALGALLPTDAATEEPDAILAIDFAYREIALARETKLMAFGIDTR